VSATPEIAKPSIKRFATRVIKLGLSSLYFVGSRIWCRLSGNRTATCVILYYHSVPKEYQGRFAKQMALLATRNLAIPITRLNDLPAARSVVITFDDALANVAENALPVLIDLNIPASIFVVSEALGRTPGWGEGYYSPNERTMSQEELLNLPDLITVGSHTLTHPNLTTLSRESSDDELRISRAKLEAMLRQPVLLFSFPHGALNDTLVDQCREVGYRQVFSTEPRLFLASQEQYVVGRVATDPWDWPAEFYLKIAGAYCWQPYAKSVVREIRRLFN